MERINGIEVTSDISSLCHFIGLDSRNKGIYHRHGKAYYRPYRNYYFGKLKSKSFEYLEREGILKQTSEPEYPDKHGNTFWWLTRKGLDFLGEKINCHIYDESD